MAKATAICTCEKCGEKFERTKTFHKRVEADHWEEWASEHFTLCNRCYCAQQQELEIAKGLYVDVRINSQSALRAEACPIAIIFGGDTMPNKENIKSIDGACYTDNYPLSGMFNDLLGMDYHPKRWVIWCDVDELNENLKLVQNIGAKIENMPSDTDLAVYNQIKREMDEKRLEKEKAIQSEMDELGEMPPWPDEITAMWPAGARWNKKFYGKTGNWRVYFSGQEQYLTDAQKESMEAVSKKRDEWRAKKQEITKKHT